MIRALGKTAPTDATVTYHGVGELEGDLPRREDRYIPLLPEAPDRGPLNLSYSRALLRHRLRFVGADIVLLHRAEHVLALPGCRRVTLLHGGSSYAFRARPSVFSSAYPFIEAYAVLAGDLTFSVAPDEHWWVTKRAGRPVPMTTCFDDEHFYPPEQGPPQASLLAAARLVPEKRLDRAIRLATDMGWPITIAGDGPLRKELEALAGSLGARAAFLGAVTSRQLGALYRAQQGVFVMTSAFEGFPVALVEAAACGLPIVVKAAPGLLRAASVFGGHVANDWADLPAAAKRALEQGNRVSTAEVALRFSAANVGAKFWAKVAQVSPS